MSVDTKVVLLSPSRSDLSILGVSPQSVQNSCLCQERKCWFMCCSKASPLIQEKRFSWNPVKISKFWRYCERSSMHWSRLKHSEIKLYQKLYLLGYGIDRNGMRNIHVGFNNGFSHCAVQVGHFYFIRLCVGPVELLIYPIDSQTHRLLQSIDL